ncbi:MAG TPA: head GIN domain-containing protein [Chitinophagaceae bacterium]|nr:head GIN domain-containing protein [Chitinophagaceae bacterium]
MKKISFLLALSLGCALTLMAQDGEYLKPSGNVITRDVAVKPFSAIKASGLYDLILTQGSNEGVKVETDDNMQSLIVVSNDGNALVIDEPKLRDHSVHFGSADNEHTKRQHFKVYVTFKNISSLDLQTIGNIHADAALSFDALQINDKSVGNINLSLTAKKLTVTNKGVGSVTLSGKVDDAVITNSGVGSFNGQDLVVQTMHINNTGVGHAEVNVVKDLMVKDSFLGKVNNSGPAKTHKMEGVQI